MFYKEENFFFFFFACHVYFGYFLRNDAKRKINFETFSNSNLGKKKKYTYIYYKIRFS